jgi:hypothetical protein
MAPAGVPGAETRGDSGICPRASPAGRCVTYCFWEGSIERVRDE